ncbi:uncharacterized protein LOC129290892 [Prosopis cineraria]|uniref:uncharacterized protein LOC129290892 n=1 Tax=Prosopis cineraria TaxID=364024 RepID=UPI002410476D|nr:uncharacterized protein LOC129290892 [Prosopis cineraria]
MENDENKKKELFWCAMKREWRKVIEMYKKDARLHGTRITRSGNTTRCTLQPQMARRTCFNGECHPTCHIIASVEPTSVDDRNDDGEKPLFLAALHGGKQAFLRLHFIRNPIRTAAPCYNNCRGNNGDTILHSAINGDYFGIYVEELQEENPEGELQTCPAAPMHIVRKPVEANAEDPEAGAQANSLFPANYKTCRHLIKFFYLEFLIILGKDEDDGNSPNEYEYVYDGNTTWSQTLATSVEPTTTNTKITISIITCLTYNCAEHEKKRRGTDTAMLVAAKNGVMEIIEKIVELFPGAIHDLNEDKKNMYSVIGCRIQATSRVPVLAEEEYLQRKPIPSSGHGYGNSALRLAATLRDHKPWLIPGQALQMQWELKWYKFVKEPMQPGFLDRYNLKPR